MISSDTENTAPMCQASKPVLKDRSPDTQGDSSRYCVEGYLKSTSTPTGYNKDSTDLGASVKAHKTAVARQLENIEKSLNTTSKTPGTQDTMSAARRTTESVEEAQNKSDK